MMQENQQKTQQAVILTGLVVEVLTPLVITDNSHQQVDVTMDIFHVIVVLLFDITTLYHNSQSSS